jgi:hypothetical protein
MLDGITYDMWIILFLIFFISLVFAHLIIDDEQDYDDTFKHYGD